MDLCTTLCTSSRTKHLSRPSSKFYNCPSKPPKNKVKSRWATRACATRNTNTWTKLLMKTNRNVIMIRMIVILGFRIIRTSKNKVIRYSSRSNLHRLSSINPIMKPTCKIRYFLTTRMNRSSRHKSAKMRIINRKPNKSFKIKESR